MMISIIIPIYNCEKNISTMLDCVHNQTYKDYEVIMIDDGSTDKTPDICDSYAYRYNNFKVIHQENQGVSAARNNGMKVALGEFITFLDADDEIPNDFLLELIKAQELTNADLIITDVVVVAGNKEVRRFTYENKTINQTESLNLLFTRKYMNSGPCAKLFRKEALQSVSFPQLKTYEDILFVKDAIINTKIISVTNATEYRYIQRENSAMYNNFAVPSLDIVIATTELADFIKKHKELDDECLYTTLSHLYQYVILIKGNKNKEAIIFKKRAKRVFRKNLLEIIKCSAFPWKEKVLFSFVAL